MTCLLLVRQALLSFFEAVTRKESNKDFLFQIDCTVQSAIFLGGVGFRVQCCVLLYGSLASVAYFFVVAHSKEVSTTVIQRLAPTLRHAQS